MPPLAGPEQAAGMSTEAVSVDAGPASAGARDPLKIFAVLGAHGASAPDPAPVEEKALVAGKRRVGRARRMSGGPAHVDVPSPEAKSGRARRSGAEGRGPSRHAPVMEDAENLSVSDRQRLWLLPRRGGKARRVRGAGAATAGGTGQHGTVHALCKLSAHSGLGD